MDAWPRCLERLEAELPAEDVHTWLKPLQASQQDSRTVLYAPNAFVRDEVESRYLQRIRELLAHFAGSDEVALEIGSLPRAAAAPATVAAAPAQPAPPMEAFAGHLDPHYTFDNFVEGRSNQLGRAAAWQAALKPGDRTHNPLLLYGGTGLGKTHLMFAAGNEMRRQNPSARVLYLRSEQFYSAFFRSLQEKTTDRFKRQFQQVDALLIDDIQFFAGKDRTQEEFFHTFNALFESRQQIIMTCDRYPREVEGLEPRLKSRLSWGLSVAIDPPDFETRAAIVLAKAQERGILVPDEVWPRAPTSPAARSPWSSPRRPCATCCGRSSSRSASPTSRRWWPTTTGCRSRTCCPSAAPVRWRARARWRWRWPRSSPSTRCPRSATPSPAATTPPCCTPAARCAT